MSRGNAVALDPEISIRLSLSVWNVVYVHLASGGPVAQLIAAMISMQSSPQVESLTRTHEVSQVPETDPSATQTLN